MALVIIGLQGCTALQDSSFLTAPCRCLDLGLQDVQIRDAFLSEGLLEAALPLLEPDAANGPACALARALEALPDYLGKDDSEAW